MSFYANVRNFFATVINESIKQGHIVLDRHGDFNKEYEITLFRKRTLVKWEGGGDYPEAFVTVWWDVPMGITSIYQKVPKKVTRAVALQCSMWFELERGFWLQDQGRIGVIREFYSHRARAMLRSIPEIEPLGFMKEGDEQYSKIMKAVLGVG